MESQNERKNCFPETFIIFHTAFLSGSDDGTIVVIPIFQLVGSANEDIDKLTLHKFAAHLDAVTDVISGKGFCNSQIISCSLDCTCKFWSLLRGTHLRTVAFPAAILGLVLSPLESEFYAAGSDGSVYKGSIKIGSRKSLSKGQQEPVKWAQTHNGAIVSLAMVNCGRNLVTASEDGSVWMWNANEGQVVFALGNHDFGNGISDLVVATEISCGKELVPRLSNGDDHGVRVGFCAREVASNLPVNETIKMEDVLAVAEKDRSRTIDMLESAITMYERLLVLILKEAKGKNSIQVTKEKDNYI